MPTSPTPIAALPTPPSRDDSANFATRGDAFLAALPTFRSETNAVATNVYNNAVEVSSNASTVSSNTTLAVNSANAAAGSAGASIWVSGTTYALGAVVWSPVNGQIYRRIVGGAGTTDPSADSTNWTNVLGIVFSGGNAGIGTASPTTPLDVTKAGGANFVATFQNTTSASPYGVWIKDAASAANAYPLFTVTNSAGTGVYLRVDSGTGNVGIGTESPAAVLHVSRNQTAATYIMADNNGTVNASTSAGFACAEGGSVSAFFRALRDGSGHAQLYNVANSALTFGTNNFERGRFDSAGNLCVGSSSPGNAGVVNISVGDPGVTAGGLQLWAPTTGSHYIQFGDSASGGAPYSGAVGYNHTDNALVFWTNQSEKARFNSTGAFVFAGGTTTADGIGITFPATQSASSNSNTLDDYEEGTWTPTIIGTGTAGTATYPAERQGKYTKIGNVVYVYANVAWTSGTGTGNLRISGLPFTSSSDTNIFTAITIAFSNNVAGTANNVQTASIPPGITQVQFEQYPVGGGTASSLAYDAAGQFSFGGFYYV